MSVKGLLAVLICIQSMGIVGQVAAKDLAYNMVLHNKETGLWGDQVNAVGATSGFLCIGSSYTVVQGTSTTTYGAINVHRPLSGSWDTFRPSDGLASDLVQVIAAEGKIAWIGTDWGLNKFDFGDKAWITLRKEEGLPDNCVNDISLGDDRIWVATNGGICTVDKANNKVESPEIASFINYSVRGLEVSGGTLWVAGGRGVVAIDLASGDNTQYTTKNGLPINQTSCIALDGGQVWVGTSRGVVRLNADSGEVVAMGLAEGLPGEGVRDLAVASTGVWIATEKGLAFYSKKRDEIQRLGGKGLPSNNILSLAMQGGALWVGTDRGLAKVTLKVSSSLILIIVAAATAGLIVLLYLGRERILVTPKQKTMKREKPPYVLCKGNPSKELCLKCKYYGVRGDRDYCEKHEKSMNMKDG